MEGGMKNYHFSTNVWLYFETILDMAKFGTGVDVHEVVAWAEFDL